VYLLDLLQLCGGGGGGDAPCDGLDAEEGPASAGCSAGGSDGPGAVGEGGEVAEHDGAAVARLQDGDGVGRALREADGPGGWAAAAAPHDGGGETSSSLPGSPARGQGAGDGGGGAAAGSGAASAGRGAAERAAALSDILGALLSAGHVVKAGFGLRYDLRRLAESYPHLPCFGGGGGGAPPARVSGHVDVLRLARAASPPAQQARLPMHSRPVWSKTPLSGSCCHRRLLSNQRMTQEAPETCTLRQWPAHALCV